SWASCWTVSTMTRLISSASAAGTVENAAVRSTSAIPPPPVSPRGGSLVTRGGCGAERVEARLEPAAPDAHADRLGEVQGCVRLFAGDDLLAEPPQRRQRLVTYPPVDERLGALRVQARRLD